MTQEHFSYCKDIVNHTVNIVEVARWLGMDVKGDRAPCPFHQEHTFGAFQFNRKEGYCHCHSCGQGRDIIGLVSYVKGVSPSTALKDLNMVFQLNLPMNDKRFSQTQRKALSEWAKKQAEQKLLKVCLARLTMIRNELKRWKHCYSPSTPQSELDPRFIYAIRHLETVELYLDNPAKNVSEQICFWMNDMEQLDTGWRQRRRLRTEMDAYLEQFMKGKINLQTLFQKHGKAVKEYERST